MNKLNFANVSDAYTIGSEQLKNNQMEIAKLRKIIESNNAPSESSQTSNPSIPNNQNIPNIPNNQSNQKETSGNGSGSGSDEEYLFFKMLNNPKFDDILKNYIIYKHPDWLINKQVNNIIPGISNFGLNTPNSVKNYIIFFIVSLMIYLLLSVAIK